MPEVVVTLSLEEIMLLGKGKTFEDVVKSVKKEQIEILPGGEQDIVEVG